MQKVEKGSWKLRMCTISWESMLKTKKVWESAIKVDKVC